MMLNPEPEDIFPTGFNLLHLQGRGIFLNLTKPSALSGDYSRFPISILSLGCSAFWLP